MTRTIIGYNLLRFKITYITKFPSALYQYFAKYALCYVGRNIICIFLDRVAEVTRPRKCLDSYALTYAPFLQI